MWVLCGSTCECHVRVWWWVMHVLWGWHEALVWLTTWWDKCGVMQAIVTVWSASIKL